MQSGYTQLSRGYMIELWAQNVHGCQDLSFIITNTAVKTQTGSNSGSDILTSNAIPTLAHGPL